MADTGTDIRGSTRGFGKLRSSMPVMILQPELLQSDLSVKCFGCESEVEDKNISWKLSPELMRYTIWKRERSGNSEMLRTLDLRPVRDTGRTLNLGHQHHQRRIDIVSCAQDHYKMMASKMESGCREAAARSFKCTEETPKDKAKVTIFTKQATKAFLHLFPYSDFPHSPVLDERA